MVGSDAKEVISVSVTWDLTDLVGLRFLLFSIFKIIAAAICPFNDSLRAYEALKEQAVKKMARYMQNAGFLNGIC